MKRALGLLVAAELTPESAQRRAAERKVRAPLRTRAKAGDDHPVETEGGDPIADAFLRARDHRPDRLAEGPERCPLLSLQGGEIVVDRRWLRGWSSSSAFQVG